MQDEHLVQYGFKQDVPGVIWRGFGHYWKYNHRVNRLGSFVEYVPGTGVQDSFFMNHTGASGTGPDTLGFTDYYSVCATTGVYYNYCEYRAVIKMRENYQKPVYKIFDIKCPVKIGQLNHVAILNGFDLMSLEDSDKLQLLQLAVESTRIDDDTIRICIKGFVNLDCKTLECKALEKDCNYSLNIYFVVAVGEPAKFQTSYFENEFRNSYEWDLKSEKDIKLDGTKRHALYVAKGLTEYPCRTLGYSAFKLLVERERFSNDQDAALHMLDTAYNIREIQQSANDQIAFSQTIFFKNWKQGMKNANPYQSWFSFKQKGSFQGTSKLACLHFGSGKIHDNIHIDGQIVWKGKNSSPSKDSRVRNFIPIALTQA